MQRERVCVSLVLTITITMSAAVAVLLLNIATFVFGVLVGLRTKTKQTGTTASAVHNEAGAPATSETAPGVELERQHEYEDITLDSEPKESINTSTNVAYMAVNTAR